MTTSHIDGKSLATNGVQVEHPAAYLTIGQPHEVLLQIRQEGMTASLDGLEIYRWKGDWSRVTQEGLKMPDALKGRNAFSISSEWVAWRWRKSRFVILDEQREINFHLAHRAHLHSPSRKCLRAMAIVISLCPHC